MFFLTSGSLKLTFLIFKFRRSLKFLGDSDEDVASVAEILSAVVHVTREPHPRQRVNGNKCQLQMIASPDMNRQFVGVV